jgi:hypothetical protein
MTAKIVGSVKNETDIELSLDTLGFASGGMEELLID